MYHDSRKLFDQSIKLFPMAVNSPVRYFKPHPVWIKSAKGSHILDADGNEYVDYCLGFGPMILGHSDPEVTSGISESLSNGFIYGAPNEYELKLGELIHSAIPSIEKMRFTNSGTEATMHAIRLSRAFTGRKLILKFSGAYHGSHDYVLQKSGSGSLTFGISSTPGIPEEVSSTVLVGEFNSIESVRQIFREFAGRIAAVIVEPVLGNVGVVLPETGFLEEVGHLCEKDGALLIFDEVITGFRFHYGGFQSMCRIVPDITILGKIIGGGLPIGLFGGRNDIMSMVSPEGPVYQGGTFSGNPISMRAGYETMRKLRSKNYSSIEQYLLKLKDAVEAYSSGNSVEIQFNHFRTMFTIFFSKKPVRNSGGATGSDSSMFMRFFDLCLKNGVYLPPSQFESNFISFSHSEDDREKTQTCFQTAFRDLQSHPQS